MKLFRCRTILTAVLLSGSVLLADEAAQRRLGDAAFYAGDYRNAITSYQSALELADKEGKPDGWAASALNLGVAYLHNGDPAGARKIYDEFRRRYPLRSAGTLPGDLLAAEGKYAEAEKFFRSLLAGEAVNADATTFSLASMYMKTGDLTKAYALFDSLASKKDSPWRHSAQNEMIYALIRQKKPAEAVAKIGMIPAAERDVDVELLLYLAEAYSGKISGLKKNFTVFLEKMPPVPHIRLMELLTTASAVAAEKKDYVFASEMLRQAMAFSLKDDVREQINRQLIVNLLKHDLKLAGAEVMAFSGKYPAAADRAQMVMSVAGETYKSGDYAGALELYTFVVDGKFTEKDKLTAAAGAAGCAEEMKSLTALERFSRFLISELPLEEKVRRQCRYAAFLEKNDRKKQAETELKAALAVAGKNQELLDETALLLLNFYLRDKNSAGIREISAVLEKSPDPEVCAAGRFESGRLLADASLYEQAREKFLQNSRGEKSTYSDDSAFMAAFMAEKIFDFPAAAAEFSACAEKYPAFEKAPEALFKAVDLFLTVSEMDKAAAAGTLLQKKYPSSEAFAALILRNAAEKGYTGDYAGAIQELEKLEKDFRDSPVADEAALLRASFLDRSGKSTEALKLLIPLYSSKNLPTASESMLRAGEILFKQGKLDEARALFIRCAAVQPGTLTSDIANGRAGDCVLSGKSPLDAELIDDCIVRFSTLAQKSGFPQIRLQAMVKTGIALEHAGKLRDALEYYEKAVYAAGDMVELGMIPDPQWCVRSCESALRLIAGLREGGALQRGLRLIDRCGQLMLPEVNFTDKMRKNFRQQLQQRR